MDWGAIQENYFFMFLFLAALSIGAFAIGILFGCIWLKFGQWANVMWKQNNSACSERHVAALLHTRRPHIKKVRCRASRTLERLPIQRAFFHAA